MPPAPLPEERDSGSHRASKVDWESLIPGEDFWRDHQKWLEERGYRLRARYQPDWIPSWRNTKKHPYFCEDGASLWYAQIMDAIRQSDGELVAMKLVSTTYHPYEEEISTFFSSEQLVSDPRNHCIRIIEVLRVPDNPDKLILVMPHMRAFNSPQFVTVGEIVDFFSQIFEGLQFIHEHHVAHRDCMDLNIMMDPRPLYPKMYHPRFPDKNRRMNGTAKHYTRTVRPTKYYFIDFGISRKYDPDDSAPLEGPIWGGDRTVPEFQESDEPRNPFPTDIYYLGNLIREDFLQVFRGLDFVTMLVVDMVQDDPTKRPTINEVVDRFCNIRSHLDGRTLRSRLIRWDEPESDIFRSVVHLFRTIWFT